MLKLQGVAYLERRFKLRSYGSFRRIATVEQLQLEQTDTHTHNHLYPRAATPASRHNNGRVEYTKLMTIQAIHACTDSTADF